MQSRTILAIDNSLEYLCIALSIGEDIVEERRIKGRESPSQVIGEEVLQMLEKRGLKPKDLSLLISTTGPGSFTGIRVALAFLKGIKLGVGIPLVGVPTLDCMAYMFSFMKGFYILPTIDAKKGEVFCALYFSNGETLERLTSYEAKKPDEIKDIIKKPCVVLGSGVKLLNAYVKNEGLGLIVASEFFLHVNMFALIKLGLTKPHKINENTIPVYGRRSEAEIKFNIQLT